jgi:site-specific recombinase XerD
LSVVEVRDWVAARAVNSAPNTVRRLTSALRTLFRFLAVNGRPGAALSAAVPTIRSTRLCHVPHGLDEQQLRQLIDAIDTSKAIGLRTAAMVQCMVILGLRAGEVAALELADIDWRAGTLRLGRTKPRRAAVLPLSPPVGRSIAAYLQRGRPKTEDRHVFVRHFMPIGLALKSVDVTCTIGRAIRHAGLILPSSGAHILRHTAAGRLVRAGAKMKEVADVLRHRELDTTRIYTKVDWPRLAEVALPWPTEVA